MGGVTKGLKILMATPAYGGILTTRYMASFLETMGAVNSAGHKLTWTAIEDGNASQARNKAADLALEHGFDKLLFVDSDQVWKAEQVMMLIDSCKEIVGGTYPYRSFPIRLVFNPLPGQRELFNEQKSSVQDFKNFENKYRGFDTIEVHHLPTGFMLIDTEVFKEMKPHRPKYKATDSITKQLKIMTDFFPIQLVKPIDSDVCQYETEDWGFCTAARECGFKVYLHTKCVVDHLGVFQFSGQSK